MTISASAGPAIWRRKVSGKYQLGAIGMNAFELYLDGKQIAQLQQHPRGFAPLRPAVDLEAGKLYPIRLDFHEFVGDARHPAGVVAAGRDGTAEALAAARAGGCGGAGAGPVAAPGRRGDEACRWRASRAATGSTLGSAARAGGADARRWSRWASRWCWC